MIVSLYKRLRAWNPLRTSKFLGGFLSFWGYRWLFEFAIVRGDIRATNRSAISLQGSDLGSPSIGSIDWFRNLEFSNSFRFLEGSRRFCSLQAQRAFAIFAQIAEIRFELGRINRRRIASGGFSESYLVPSIQSVIGEEFWISAFNWSEARLVFSLSKKLLKSCLPLRWFELIDLSRVNEEKRK